MVLLTSKAGHTLDWLNTLIHPSIAEIRMHNQFRSILNFHYKHTYYLCIPNFVMNHNYLILEISRTDLKKNQKTQFTDKQWTLSFIIVT
jgi:hypothetical protein